MNKKSHLLNHLSYQLELVIHDLDLPLLLQYLQLYLLDFLPVFLQVLLLLYRLPKLHAGWNNLVQLKDRAEDPDVGFLPQEVQVVPLLLDLVLHRFDWKCLYKLINNFFELFKDPDWGILGYRLKKQKCLQFLHVLVLHRCFVERAPKLLPFL